MFRGTGSDEMNMKRWGSAWLTIALALVSVWACAAEKTTYYVTNAQGTVVATMDSQSNVTYTATYRPYGEQQLGTPQAGPGYTGHVNDPDTGIVYMQQRYYDPSIGRFLSTDPLPPKAGLLFAFSRYAYAENNPIRYIDPTGMNACGTSDDSTCLVKVTFSSRSTDSNGKYSDSFSKLKGNDKYNATATVFVNGKKTGTFLARTVPSGSKFATIKNGTYAGVLHYHHGRLNQPSIHLLNNGSGRIPTIGPNSANTGMNYATWILVHPSGGVRHNPLGYTGLLPGGGGVSEGCQLVARPQYGQFAHATGMVTSDGSPSQKHYTVVVDTNEN
jgi:RHS repeat-associated protein